MRREWYSMLAVLGLLLIGFTMLPTMASAQDPEPATCSDGDAYLQAGALSLAEQVYKAVNEAHPQEECALNGLQQVAERRCELAQKKVEAGDLEGAKSTYTAVLESYPDLQCASDGLAALAPASCSDGDAYLQAGALSLAEQVYKAVNEAHPQEECALNGLQQVAERRCELAQKKAEAGDLEGAKSTYTAVLESYPDLQCANDGLAALPTGYDEVKGLVRIGDYDEAWTKLKAAITANPDDRDLERLAGQWWARWQGAEEWLTYYAQPIAVGILVIAIVVVAGVWLRRRMMLTLDVVAFELGMVKLEEDPSKGPQPEKVLIAQFEQELARLGSEAYKLRRPDVIDTPLEPPNLPTNIGSVPKEVEGLWDFIAKLIPANVVEIKGTLKHDSGKGAGLYVKLVHSRTNELWGSYTVWQREINPDYKSDGTSPDISAYVQLIEFAAISAYWRIFQHKRRDLRRVFGTDNAQSYYITTRLASPLVEILRNRSFTPGKEKEEEEEIRRKVEKLSRNALMCDHKNYTAQLYLGQVLGTLEYIESAKSHTKPMNPVRITANYILGVSEIGEYIAATEKTEKKEHLTNARQLLKEAVKNAEKSKRWRKTVISDDYIAMLKIPYASVLWWADVKWPWLDPVGMIDEIVSEHYTSARVSYNLACHFSMAVQFNKLSTDALDKALHYLEDTMRVEPGYASYAKIDPTLTKVLQMKESDVKKLFAKYKPSTPTSPPSPPPPSAKPATLASLVESENAKRLQAAKVESEDDLLRKASKRQDREALAEQCAINEERLLHWTRAVELVRVRGIDVGRVVLLDAAGVSSLKKLRTSKGEDVAELHDKLEQAKKKRPKVITTLPDKETLTWWIEQAKHTQSQVEPEE